MKISINGTELEAVTVPEDCKVTLAGSRLIIHKPFKRYWWLNEFTYEPVRSIYIPCARYELLGICNQIPEEVAAGIVPEKLDYTSIIEIYLPTFNEALCSLIESHGLLPGFTYLLKEK